MTAMLEDVGQLPDDSGEPPAAAASPRPAPPAPPVPAAQAAGPARPALLAAVSDEPAVVDWLLCARALNLVNLDPLPSESDLRSLLRAPRHAVRVALSNLAAAGLIHRRRAVGTSVPGSGEKELGALWSSDNGPTRSYRMIATERLRGNQVAQQLFQDRASSGDAAVPGDELIRIQRLTLNAENTPLSLSSIYLSVAAYERIGDAAWQLPSTEAAEIIAGRAITGRYTINAIPAEAESSALLGIPAGSPCLHLERAFSDGARTVLVVFARLPGIRVGIRTNLTPDTWPSGPDAGE
jgi:DNA-binding GntR family transcriptional regulator